MRNDDSAALDPGRSVKRLHRRELLQRLAGMFGIVGLGVLGACAPTPAAPPSTSAPAATSAPVATTAPAKPTAPAAASPTNPPTAPPATNPTAPAAAAAKPGGKTLTIGEWQQVSIMNTLMTSEGGNVISGTKLALRGLLYTDDKGAFEGELASDVPSTQNGGISADGKTITYKLRPNITWHDGQPATSADVVYTWKAIMQPDHNVASRYGYDRIDTVEAPDAQTVSVRFKEPFAPWATLFDIVLPQHILEKDPDFNG